MRLFQTERTTVRQMTLADAPFILELVNSPTWIRFIGDRNIQDLDAAERYLKDGFLAYYATPGFSYYLVETRDGEPIGICGFLKKAYLEHEDLGFAFDERYQGQGFGYEVGRPIMDYGVDRFGFRVLDAVTNEDNAASIGLLGKLGFRPAGTIEIPGSGQGRLFRWELAGRSRSHARTDREG